MVDRKIMRDIEKILLLARRAHEDLEKKDITKAKKELKRVMRYNLDELSRLQEKHGDKRVLRECAIAFRNAKEALRVLNSTQLSKVEEAEKLIDEVMKLEGHQLQEESELEKREKEHHEFWKKNFFDGVFYHGSCSISLARIKRYGLSPDMRAFDQYDLNRLKRLIEKAGGYPVIGGQHGTEISVNEAKELNKGGFFMTGNYVVAKIHAKDAPTIWAEFIGTNRGKTGTWDIRDYNGAKRGFIMQVLLHHHQTINIPPDLVEDFYRLYSIDARRTFLRVKSFIRDHNLPQGTIGKLNEKEFLEAVRIFDKLWRFFDKGYQGIVFYIDRRAPAIMEKIGKRSVIYENFEEYLNVFRHVNVEKAKSVLENVNFFVSERIPAKYITKVEEV